MTRYLRILTVALLALGLAGLRVAPAHAQTTITVTDCTDDSGPGTLRDAVTQTNNEPVPPDQGFPPQPNYGNTITFSCSGTISLQSPLSITKAMTIDGSGQNVVIDGGNSVQLFTVIGPGSGVGWGFTWVAALRHLTLQHGSGTTGGAIDVEGAALLIDSSTLANNAATTGGAIYDNSANAADIATDNLTVQGSTLANNTATNGGAIYDTQSPPASGNGSLNQVSIATSTFSNNSATNGGNGGAIDNAAGQITFGGNLSQVSIASSTFSGNSATTGGAIDNGQGQSGNATVSVATSTFANNSATSGGAINNSPGQSGSVTVNVATSTFSDNSASCSGTDCQTYGGAVENGPGQPGNATVNVASSSFANNSASCSGTHCSTNGGAIDNSPGQSGSATVSIASSTFAGNSASCSGGDCVASGAAINSAPPGSGVAGASMSIGGSIVAGDPTTNGGNCSGVLTDNGYNLEDTAPSTCGFSAASHDIVGTIPGFVLDGSGNPLLASNGGPTQTIALAASSPAIDQVPAANCPGTDQRGATRPDDSEGVCDMGAYESASATTTTAAPSIVRQPQPQSQTTWVGDTVSLSVMTSGNPAPSYQWYASTDGTTFTAVSGATNAWFTTPTLTAPGVDSYYVHVSNAAGSVDSATVTVTVRPALAWQTTPPLPTALSYLAATTGADGTIYAIGGFGPTTVTDDGQVFTVNTNLNTVYSFKPGTDTQWQQAPSLPVPLQELAATTGADGTIYAIGGKGSDGSQSTVYSFKPGTDTQWHQAPSLPAPREFLAATTGSDGTIYAIGGKNASGVGQSTVYSFKPGTDTQWQQAPSLPTDLSDLAATTGADGTIYAIGGVSLLSGEQSTVYGFRPGADTQWQTATSLPNGRYDLAATTGSDGTIYAIGGQGVSSDGGVISENTVYSAYPGPTITQQPQGQTISAGSTATLSVAASGTPSPTYQWYASSTGAAGSFTAISGATRASYTTPTLTATGVTYYYVRVANELGSVNSTTVSVTVTPGPVTRLAVIAPTGATAGSPFQVTVSARDQYGNMVTGYAGTVHFTSSDSQALLPADSALTGGTGTFSVTLKTAGPQTISATDTNNAGITGSSNAVTVLPAGLDHFKFDTVSSPQAVGASFGVTITAYDAYGNVATGYAGTPTLSDTSGTISPTTTGAFSNGSWSGQVTVNKAGSDLITATDGSHSGTSNSFTVIAATTTSVTSSANPSVFGQSVTFTAAVTSPVAGLGTPTGTVQFSIDGTKVGSPVPLDRNGKATYTTSSLTVTNGTNHTVSAAFTSTSSSFANSSGSLSGGQEVDKAATSTALTSSLNPAMSGQQVTFTATVSVQSPGAGSITGSVTFKDGSTTLGTRTVGTSSGVTTATYSTSSLAVGSHSITAVYGGSSTLVGSTSSALTQNVDTSLSSYPKLSNGAYNLQNATLSNAYLVNLNLANASAINATLTGADLSGATLTSANLTQANLTNANLSGANLTGANLSQANLSGANLSSANLTNANLSQANLKGATGMSTATLTGVTWSKTTCPDGTTSNQDGGTCLGHL